ncbi:MAG: hypothetical protein GC137_09230 [Alphaproteobacteria bacterium]|nr:hypothetical protein [Alphaproteobacteria bacterium]
MKVKKKLFTPTKKNKSLMQVFLLLTALGLPGCLGAGKVQPLAPLPPAIDLASYENQKKSQDNMTTDHSIITVHQASEDGLMQEVVDIKDAPKTAVVEEKKCNLKDRFDRDAFLAYEWDRSRLSMDVDGINTSGDGNMGIKIEYRLRFQKWKNKKERCRYDSQWQGLVGSGYNEMFRREDNTMWGEINKIRKKASEFVDEAF